MFPKENSRQDPIHKPAQKPPATLAHGAAIILIHGLGDTAEGLENIADQFQSAGKLQHLHWLIPNAKENRDAMATAWYTPHSFAPIPAGRPELEPDEDEEGLLESVAYIESLIEVCVAEGIPPQRIVLAGFSQGCALSLLTTLVSKVFSGRLAGIIGLMGYLPLATGQRLAELRTMRGLNPTIDNVAMLMARGQRDQLVPKRIFDNSVTKLAELGLPSESLEVHEYPGLGHSLNASVMQDMCAFLERVVPSLDD